MDDLPWFSATYLRKHQEHSACQEGVLFEGDAADPLHTAAVILTGSKKSVSRDHLFECLFTLSVHSSCPDHCKPVSVAHTDLIRPIVGSFGSFGHDVGTRSVTCMQHHSSWCQHVQIMFDESCQAHIMVENQSI